MPSLLVQQPWWLLLLLLPPLLWWLYQSWAKHRSQHWLTTAVQPFMLLRVKHWSQLPWHWLAIWTLLVMALSQPLWLSSTERAQHQPMQWVAVVDLSASMQATDMLPNRLQQVRWALESAAHHWQAGDVAGIYVFAGSHHWLVPLTQDVALWQSSIELLATDLLPLQGSLIDPAMQSLSHWLAEQQLNNTAIVLFTDGANTADGLSSVAPLSQTGIVLPIGRIDAHQWPVDIAALAAYAQALGLEFIAQQPTAEQLTRWLAEWRAAQPVAASAAMAGHDLSTWLLLLALLLWFGQASWRSSGSSTPSIGLLLCTTLTLSPPMKVEAVELDKQPAYAQVLLAYQQQHYDEVIALSTQALRVATAADELQALLVLLGDALLAESRWHEAAQSYRVAMAQPVATPSSLADKYTAVLAKVTELNRQSAQAGDAFVGQLTDWDEQALDWETKDVLFERVQENRSQANFINAASSAVVRQQTHTFARQTWAMSGEMRQKQQEKRQFYLRLFSLEAGFAAVPETAQPIDGVAPW